MPFDPDKRKRYYNLCDPREPLEPGDPRNVDIDSLGNGEIRGLNWVERLAARIELSNEPVFSLFTGLPGSGKSTELKRLKVRLEDPSGANLLVVEANAEELLDSSGTLDIPDLIAAILYSAERTVIQAEGGDPERAMQDGYFKRLFDWLTTTDVQFTKGEFAIPSGPKLVAEMRLRPALRKRVRSFLASNLGRYLTEARQEIARLDERARKRGRSGLALIFDSLEKVRGTSDNWDEVLQSAEHVFAGGAPYLRLPIHTLYTIPVPLVVRRLSDVEFIPMLKLHDRRGVRFEPGFEAARTIVHKRIPPDVLPELLGADADARLDEIIVRSGGYARELIRLLQAAVLSPTHPLSEPAFRRVLSEAADNYTRVLTEQMKPWLARVREIQALPVENSDELRVASRALQNNLVHRYFDRTEWFDVTPAIRDAVRA